MRWINKETYFDEESAYERVRGKNLAPWYRDMTDDQFRERLQWLKDCLACEDHQPAYHDVAHIRSHGISSGFSKCKCGAFKWDSENRWQEMSEEDRDKREEEVFVLTQYFAEQGGVYAI